MLLTFSAKLAEEEVHERKFVDCFGLLFVEKVLQSNVSSAKWPVTDCIFVLESLFSDN